MPYDGTKFRWQNRRVSSGEAVFGEVLYQAGGFCGPRVQRDFELVTVRSGEAHLTLNNIVHPLKTGVAYLLRPGGREYFEFAADKETHQLWCAVRRAAMPPKLQKALTGDHFSAPCSPLLNALLDAAVNLESELTGGPPPLLVEHLAFSVFAEFRRISTKENRDVQKDAAVHAFVHYVKVHFGEEECLAAGRRAAGVSRNTLLYKFHQSLQTTPAQYLWKLRVERGVAMLVETGQSIGEIAYRCGFKNPFHFSRLLTKQVGYSPKEIRSRAWSENGR